ncbi:MAG TPA: HIT family protein [Patescibacteria group bacterium]|nr:HIT family protein [Patescibacteria group bacterium]
MAESLFTKIIKGEIPSFKVYEDENTFVFLDIYPIQPGHTLVVPKIQTDYLWNMDDQDYINLMKTVKKIANRLKNVSTKPYVGLKVIGIDIEHAHVHLIPFSNMDEYNNIPDRSLPPDNKKLKEMADKLKFN